MTTTLALVRDLSHGPLLSDHAVVSPSEQVKLAAAYDALPSYGPGAVRAWSAMAAEVVAQHDLLESYGFTFEVNADDPYESAADMFRDVEENRHIACLSTQVTGGHPFFTDDENDAFRQVHDVFGHFAAQRGFDRHGEEAAYRRHTLMFSPLASRAMATETRGQNAALIVHGEFRPEKVAILPEEWRSPYALTPCGPEEWNAIREFSSTVEISAFA